MNFPIIAERPFPIPVHETWQIVDSTKLTCFLTCPRKFFYEFLLGWRSTAPNNHLVFGQAWHEAMEHLLLNGYTNEAIIGAFDKFFTCYRQQFPPDTDELMGGKTPENAFKALMLYTDLYKTDLSEFDVLKTEIAGVIHISKVRELHFRQDAICRRKNGQHFSLEHKTTGGFSSKWSQQWELGIQTGTYAHVLHCLFPADSHTVRINGVSFKKLKKSDDKIEFLRVPIRRTTDHMANWLWTVNHYMDMIEYNLRGLAECTENDPVMQCFPMNPESCTKYFGCAYHDYCTTWANPLRYCIEPPMDMDYFWWNPAELPASETLIIGENGGE